MPRIPGAKNLLKQVVLPNGDKWPFPAEYIERMEAAGFDEMAIRKVVGQIIEKEFKPKKWNQETIFANKTALVEKFKQLPIPQRGGVAPVENTAPAQEQQQAAKFLTDNDHYYNFVRIKNNAHAAKMDHKYIDNHGYIDAVSRIVVDNEYAVLLMGPSGTGKTELMRHIAAQMGLELVRFNMNVRTEPEDLEGRWVPTDEVGKFVFKDGPLVEAMIEGKMLLVDEVNASKASVMMMFHAILEHGHEYRVSGDKGNRVITPHQNFRIAFTANPASYAGTSEFNPAFLSRCIVFNFEYPKPSTESSILSEVYPNLDKELRQLLCKFAENSRKHLKQNPETQVTVNTRDLLKAARLVNNLGFTPRHAVELSILNGAKEIDESTYQALASLADAQFPVKTTK